MNNSAVRYADGRGNADRVILKPVLRFGEAPWTFRSFFNPESQFLVLIRWRRGRRTVIRSQQHLLRYWTCLIRFISFTLRGVGGQIVWGPSSIQQDLVRTVNITCTVKWTFFIYLINLVFMVGDKQLEWIYTFQIWETSSLDLCLMKFGTLHKFTRPALISNLNVYLDKIFYTNL